MSNNPVAPLPPGGIPEPSARRIALRVTPEAERAVRAGHPWLFDRAIREQSHEGEAGDLAVIFDRKGRFMAVGLYDPSSALRVRILQSGQAAAIGVEWFAARIGTALKRRAPLAAQPPAWATTGYRLVHGENDGLPGLVIDRYGDTLVCKLYTPAWVPHLRDVVEALAGLVPAQRLVLRLARSMAGQAEGLYGLSDGLVLSGPPLDGPVLFWESGLCFEADVAHGQKTGFFFDQRDNRASVEKLAKGKAVLNVFAYTGGFSVYAGRGGARSVLSVDLSQPALEAAGRNWERNQDGSSAAGRTAARVSTAVSEVTAGSGKRGRGSARARGREHETLSGDAFEVLTLLARSGRRFGLVIVDPPAFAQTQAQVAPALASYERLTTLSLRVVEPGGTLVQASCSSRVDADTFFAAIHRAAARAGRPLRELERSGHALDHPITFKEGAYLKCLFATAA